MIAPPTSRALDRVGREHYGHRISFATPAGETASVAASGILRQIWRENFGNSIPGRCVAIDDDTTGALTVFGPLPLSFSISDHGPAAATPPHAQSASSRPDWVPSRIESLTLRWWGGPRDQTEKTIAPEQMRRRFFSSYDARPEKAEYVWNQTFTPDKNRRFTADFWYAGWVTAEETLPTTGAPGEAVPLAPGGRYRMQFRNGPLVDLIDHYQVSLTGKPLTTVILPPEATGRLVPTTYAYTGFGALSAAGVRCTYRHIQ
ncbi:hypothetical protein GCM10022198_07210 [Klugiella xanthotipulae]|uniref:Uncharacterized protein n=1 Tax=Klugiella xanthotipulae TaxID=244735 RepID=A0A543HT33_9MICO|nr:hypothetical protein [Klugiella xanthotipulae]TQM61516.1 hypothetical protein FB466_2472 [Klugiella xanthotipulae]